MEPLISNFSSAAPRRKTAEVHSLLEALISKREHEIMEIEQMVERYERRLRLEEQAYRSMSTLRRMLTGKKPDHHLAVEYIHYVKKPMEQVRTLRHEIANFQAMLDGTIPAILSEL
jgi:acetyl-CoA carboxylase alpha subunit